MEPILAKVPRILMWAAAGIAATALVTIIVVQIMTVVMTTRPPMLTRWLTGLFVIASQSIFASIALGIASYALHSTQVQRERVPAKFVVASPARPLATAPSARIEQVEPSLPSDLRSAIAAASSPEKRRR